MNGDALDHAVGSALTPRSRDHRGLAFARIQIRESEFNDVVAYVFWPRRDQVTESTSIVGEECPRSFLKTG